MSKFQTHRGRVHNAIIQKCITDSYFFHCKFRVPKMMFPDLEALKRAMDAPQKLLVNHSKLRRQ